MAGKRQEIAYNVVGNPSHPKIDFISFLPDDIIQRILSFIPTNLVVKTSVLSKRWRHVWCQSPYLYFDRSITTAKGINQTLNSYTAPKIISFNLRFSFDHLTPSHIDSFDHSASEINNLIYFALSRNVHKVFVTFASFGLVPYIFPSFFCLSSCIQQLTIARLRYGDLVFACTVSWKSLRNLSLRRIILSDESLAKILCGSPKLQSLRLHHCGSLERLDLSNSPSVTTLVIICNYYRSGPTEIVAPHVHYLRLTISHRQCTLVDVSSLTQADLDICPSVTEPSKINLQIMVLEMLAKLHNVEKLTVRAAFLQILSLACVPFPTLALQTLIVKTRFIRSVMPGVAKLLQNSPGLKKLIAHPSPIRDKDVDNYVDFKDWGSKYNVFPTAREFSPLLPHHMSKLSDSFTNLVFENAKTLERVVERLGGICFYDDAKWFEEHSPHNNKIERT